MQIIDQRKDSPFGFFWWNVDVDEWVGLIPLKRT